MALTEKLRLVIDADGKGAIKGLEGVGAAADRNLGKTDDKLAKVGAGLTTFGTATLAAAAVAGAGLYKVAQSASAYGEQVSRATKVFGDEAIPELEAFADAAAETAGISKTEALQAASNFAAFGKAAGLTGTQLAAFSEELVQSAGDFASLNDIPVDEAIMAFGSALAGESEPLRRYGIDVSAAAVNNKALELGIGGASGALTESEKVLARNAILMEEGALWAGDFADTSDSLGNRQKKLAADFENTKVALGAGLLPIAETAIGSIGSLADAFGDLSPETQSAIGKFLGLATVGAGVVGSISLVAGQAIKLHDRFTTVTGSGDDATRSLNNFGRAAKGITIGAAVIGGLLALNEILDGLTDKTVEFQTGMDRLAAADTGAKALDALLESAEAADSGWENFVESMQGGGSKLTSVGSGVDKVTFEMDELEAAMTAAADAGKMEQLQQGIDQLYALSAASGEALPPEVIELLATFQDRINAAAGAADAATDDVDALGTGMDGLTGSTEETTSALEEYANALKAQHDPLFAAVDATEGLQDAQRGVYDAQAEVNKLLEEGKGETIEYSDAVEDLDDAQRDAARAAMDQEVAMADLALAVRDGSVNVDKARDQMVKWGRQAGLTERDAQRVADEYLGAADAADELGSKHPEPTADMDVVPFYRKYWPAAGSVDTLGRKTAKPTIDAYDTPYWSRANRINGYRFPTKFIDVQPNWLGWGRPPGSHGGRAAMSPTGGPHLVGEQGPELFLPERAGSLVPNHKLGNYAATGGGVGVTYQVNVSTGLATNPAETGRAVVDAIRSYERTNGDNWRN